MTPSRRSSGASQQRAASADHCFDRYKQLRHTIDHLLRRALPQACSRWQNCPAPSSVSVFRTCCAELASSGRPARATLRSSFLPPAWIPRYFADAVVIRNTCLMACPAAPAPFVCDSGRIEARGGSATALSSKYRQQRYRVSVLTVLHLLSLPSTMSAPVPPAGKVMPRGNIDVWTKPTRQPPRNGPGRHPAPRLPGTTR